jgi:CubicO group peptidase (beta-lactamase class C family)
VRQLKTTLIWLGLLVLVVAALAVLPARLGVYGLYWKRYVGAFMTNPLNPAFSWYEPMETVRGHDAGSLPIVEMQGLPFRPEALEEAVIYARAHNSDALVVLHAGRVVLEQYWNMKKADTPWAVHSLTKTLTAILIGHAIADGFISSVDVPAATYIPEWDTPERRGITLRHLLNMASGLKESFNYAPTSLRMQRTMGTDIVAPNLRTEVGRPPGKRFAHINPDPQVLGIIIERATGRRFTEYLSEKFWQPIGARDALMFLDREGGMVHTDCCMWATPMDWARVGEALRLKGVFARRQVIPAGWLDEMLRPSAAYANYGMQLWLGTTYERQRRYDPDIETFANYHSEPFAAPDVFFLDGLGKQRVYVVPSRELVIVRSGSNDPDWDDAKLPNLLIRGMIS